MCDRVANTLSKRAQKKATPITTMVSTIETVSAPAPAPPASSKPLLACYRCKSTGHRIRDCPVPPSQEELE